MSQPPPQPRSRPGPPPMVEAHGVSKWFGDLVAVSDVTFGVAPGVTALLGPNGAGKSTVFRLLCGLATPSSGEVRVLGRSPRSDPSVTRSIGLVPQQEALFDELTALEFVRLAAVLHRLGDPDGAARRSLRLVELDADDTRPLSTYSKGMRQRVKVAQGIVHEPAVLFLDEPLTGLDPRQRNHMIALFHRLGAEGRCVMVTSHVLDEVARIGSRVLVMAKGRLAAEGDYRDLRTLMDDRPQRVRVLTDKPLELAAAMVSAGVLVGLDLEGDACVFETSDGSAFARRLPREARRLSATLTEVRPLDDDLESVFRYLVGTP